MLTCTRANQSHNITSHVVGHIPKMMAKNRKIKKCKQLQNQDATAPTNVHKYVNTGAPTNKIH